MKQLSSCSTSLTRAQPRSLCLKDRVVVLGRDDSATLSLYAPTVSRRHATISAISKGRYLLHDCSTNGTFVDGKQVTGSTILRDGARLQIGPFSLVRLGDRLEVIDFGERLSLEACGLIIQHKGKRRLDDISLAIEPGQFVALVGGSGAGKSSLLRALLGIESLTEGVVYLNGSDLRKNFNIYRLQLGYVPQDDIIHQELTVLEVLTYAAKLRLAPDINVETTVQKTLEDIEMLHCRRTLVKELSGGQRKRVSIGVELLADPKLFFLDEPTSGLDPGLDRRMMQLLRKLADQGRTVILVTHATANIKLCDRICFLGQGGRLCYFGLPSECLKFFNVKDEFAEVYTQLEKAENVIHQAVKFRSSADYQRYIGSRISPMLEIQQRAAIKTPLLLATSWWHQFGVLTERYFQTAWRDRLNLFIALLTAPVGIALVATALTDRNPFILQGKADIASAQTALQILFTFSCAALWIGLSSSLPEIVKESAIYWRERLVNLSLFAYLGSKVGVLSALALWQAVLMVATVNVCFDSPVSKLAGWSLGVCVTTFLTISASSCLGLFVSAFVSNVNQANSALPLLLLPQIVFSGVLFKLEGIAKFLSWLTVSRWSIGAYGAILDINQMIPSPVRVFGRTISQPLEDNPVYTATWTNLVLNWVLLSLHATIYLLVAFWLQKRKDCIAEK